MTGINKYLKYFGIEIRKLNLNVYRFKQKYLLDKNKITNLLDVGASGGLYGKLVRSYGYSGNIFSFEPVKKSYDILAKSAANDTSWYCYNYALGSNDRKMSINVANDGYSTSFLNINDGGALKHKNIHYQSKEIVEVKKLDSIVRDLPLSNGATYLKIDTQGFEMEVLQGGELFLNNIDMIELELSFYPLYEGELTFEHYFSFLEKMEYKIVNLKPGFTEESTGIVLQSDFVFKKMFDHQK